jgi:hypothetical protein
MIPLISKTCESFPTVIAFEGTISSVCPKVYLEVPHLRKKFVAIRIAAYIVSLGACLVLIGFMDPQSVLASEMLIAIATFEGCLISFLRGAMVLRRLIFFIFAPLLI